LEASKVDENGHPIIARLSAVAIVRVFLPMVAPTLKLVDFTTKKTCAKWLGELDGDTTWVVEMTALEVAWLQEAASS
jgi:hypothetical protein